MDVVESFPANAQTAEAVEPGDRPLDDPAEGAQASALGLLSLGDHRSDTPLTQ
ncbi:hypothetical protein GL259_00635 [Streptomyces sp. Tu 3180]|nr:hypothetical protein GL259_00635 [Streptomyces sp. Tu 3180]